MTSLHLRIISKVAFPFFRNIIMFLLPWMLLVGCATTPDPQLLKQANAHNKLGHSYLQNGQLNIAYVEFQKAIKLSPDNAETLNYLGYISALFKDYNQAIEYYKKAIAVNPEYSDAMSNLGVVYLDLEQWDEAIKTFSAALRNPLHKTPETAYSSTGYAYYMKGDFISAEKSLNEALIRNPILPMAMYTLGLVYIKTGMEDKAVKEFQKAVGIFPDYMDAHWELASAYMRAGDRAKALKHFRLVAEGDRDIQRARKAKEHVERLKY
ncbi:MAG: tetratricopeptide repeat protein [Nitrospira sp.]|nr:tetratricopeptide repeat protein [Nitrospira sp.]